MRSSKFFAFALVILGFGAAPAVAAPINYFLDVPLYGATEAGSAPDLTLRGTLSYDGDEAMTGTGTFSIGDAPAESFAGFTFLMDLGTESAASLGVLFDGVSASGSSLYMNFATGLSDTVSGTVNYCTASGCALFGTAAATLLPAMTSPIDLPSTPIGLPVGSVSPVPLPPAVSLFGGALAILAIGAMARRAVPRPQGVRV